MRFVMTDNVLSRPPFTRAPVSKLDKTRHLTNSTADPMYFVAAHEAGHAVALILSHRALGRRYPSFHRVFIRRDFSIPYIDGRNREVDCSGLCEGPDLYTPGIGLGAFYLEPEPHPGWKCETLTRIEWAIVASLAGPFAEAASLGFHSKANMLLTALFHCGSTHDFRAANTVLLDYKKASRRRRGMPFFADRTRDLVLKSGRAIVALANALLVKETLDHDAAYAVVEPFLGTPLDAGLVPPAIQPLSS
jgi:hypothetical protein